MGAVLNAVREQGGGDAAPEHQQTRPNRKRERQRGEVDQGMMRLVTGRLMLRVRRGRGSRLRGGSQ
jgi:hypothetical protein